MKRDMELIRKILFTIEDKYVDVWLHSDDIPMDGYDLETISYHCAILHEAALLSEYKAQYASDHLYYFGVGRLTWEGHELLDKIRSDTVWNKTTNTIREKGIPFVLDAVKEIATSITAAMITATIKG